MTWTSANHQEKEVITVKTNWKRISMGVLAVIVALVSVLTVSSVAFAQGPGGQGRGGNQRSGLMGHWGDSTNSLVAVAADVLGMERADLVAELQTGKTIAQVAQEQGVDPQTIVDAFIAIRAEILAEAVANGCITQEQADLMLEHLAEEATTRVYEPFSPGEHGQGTGGRGRHGGGRCVLGNTS
jgi:nucleotide-binding universal stress UspA family protein